MYPMLFYKTHSSLNIGVTGNRYPLRMWISYKHVALKLKIASYVKLATSDPLISSSDTVTRPGIPYEDVLLGVTPVGSPPHRTLDSVAHNCSLLQCIQLRTRVQTHSLFISEYLTLIKW